MSVHFSTHPSHPTPPHPGSFSAEDVALWVSFLDQLSVLQILNVSVLPERERAVFFLNLYHVMVRELRSEESRRRGEEEEEEEEEENLSHVIVFFLGVRGSFVS